MVRRISADINAASPSAGSSPYITGHNSGIVPPRTPGGADVVCRLTSHAGWGNLLICSEAFETENKVALAIFTGEDSGIEWLHTIGGADVVCRSTSTPGRQALFGCQTRTISSA